MPTAGDVDMGLGMGLEIEPPRRFAVRPAVHRHRHQVRTVFEVAEDDAALLASAAPDGGEAHGTPPARFGAPQADPAACDPIQPTMRGPGEPDKPSRRNPYPLRGHRSALRRQGRVHASQPSQGPVMPVTTWRYCRLSS